jgi:hypothetical protein
MSGTFPWGNRSERKWQAFTLLGKPVKQIRLLHTFEIIKIWSKFFAHIHFINSYLLALVKIHVYELKALPQHNIDFPCTDQNIPFSSECYHRICNSLKKRWRPVFHFILSYMWDWKIISKLKLWLEHFRNSL